MSLMKSLIFLLLNLVVICVALSLFGFYFAIRPMRIISDITPNDFSIPFEPVSFTTEDHVLIRGWYIPAKQTTAKTIILMHGYPADKGNIFPATQYLQQHYNLLYFDFRYLGESGGYYSTLGKNEPLDLLAAIRYLQSRGTKEVIVWGLSLGGAVALMTTPLSENIKCVIAESPYARLDWIANDYYQIPLLKYPLAQLTRLWGKLFLGINVDSVSPVEAAAKIKIPVLLIHSTNDPVIPYEHAQALQQALKNNPKSEVYVHDDAGHGARSVEMNQIELNFLAKHCPQ